jgi:hypothetical protein
VNDEFASDSGYYAETFSYPHELVDFPHRLVRAALREVAVADLDPTLMFFQRLLPWFERGRLPVGWAGGKVIVW